MIFTNFIASDRAQTSFLVVRQFGMPNVNWKLRFSYWTCSNLCTRNSHRLAPIVCLFRCAKLHAQSYRRRSATRPLSKTLSHRRLEWMFFQELWVPSDTSVDNLWDHNDWKRAYLDAARWTSLALACNLSLRRTSRSLCRSTVRVCNISFSFLERTAQVASNLPSP